MKFIFDKHYNERVVLSTKFSHESTTEFRTVHWHDEKQLNTALEINHGAMFLSLYKITAEELRALATMLADTADQIDAHQAQLADEVMA